MTHWNDAVDFEDAHITVHEAGDRFALEAVQAPARTPQQQHVDRALDEAWRAASDMLEAGLEAVGWLNSVRPDADFQNLEAAMRGLVEEIKDERRRRG